MITGLIFIEVSAGICAQCIFVLVYHFIKHVYMAHTIENHILQHDSFSEMLSSYRIECSISSFVCKIVWVLCDVVFLICDDTISYY